MKPGKVKAYIDDHLATIIGWTVAVLLGAFLSLQSVPISSESVRAKVVNMTEPADSLPWLHLELENGDIVISPVPKEVPVRYGKFVELNKFRTIMGRDRYQFVRYEPEGD